MCLIIYKIVTNFLVLTVCNWRASVASETLTGVKMKKSGMFVYWRASEASETVLVVCLSTNGERALNYTIVIQTTKIKLSC